MRNAAAGMGCSTVSRAQVELVVDIVVDVAYNYLFAGLYDQALEDKHPEFSNLNVIKKYE